MKQFVRRGGSAVALAALATLVMGGSAMAEGSVYNIDPDAPATLTITKMAQPDAQGGAASGLETTVDADPLAGAIFTVAPVTAINGQPVDMTTQAGWEAIQAATPDTVTAGEGTPMTATDASGVTTGSFAQGVYLVTETTLPDGAIAGVPPFIAVLPMPGATAGDWNYDVHVYPKNSLASITKSVDDSVARGLGDVVSWTGEAAVPVLPETEPFSAYVIGDVLDARLTYVDGSAVATWNGTPALDAADYTVAYDLEAHKLTVTFTAAGLAKLDGAVAGNMVTLTYDTEVTSIVDPDADGPLVDGVIPNTMTLDISRLVDNVSTPSEQIETPPVDTQWGAVEIYKHVEGDTTRPLGEAVFQVFNADDTDFATPISVDVDGVATTDFVTDASGFVNIPGLKAGDYVIKEIKAPAGYIASTATYPVTVAAGMIVDATSPAEADALVPNAQSDVPELPPLGADDLQKLGLAAAGFIGVGISAVAISAKRKKATASAE